MARFNSYSRRDQSKKIDKKKRECLQNIKLCLLCVAFYCGVQSGKSNSNYSNEKYCDINSSNWKFDKTEIDEIVNDRINTGM